MIYSHENISFFCYVLFAPHTFYIPFDLCESEYYEGEFVQCNIYIIMSTAYLLLRHHGGLTANSLNHVLDVDESKHKKSQWITKGLIKYINFRDKMYRDLKNY